MTARPRGGQVVVEARAKLNLGLAVGPRRTDGFHELATIFQSVSLADTLVARPRTRGFDLSVRHEDVALAGGVRRRRPEVSAGPRNLVLAAARLLAAHDPRIGGARFTLIKRIPTRAGMGGGSADAAAALAALDALYGVRRSRAERLELAAALGSDVPFALLGGTALGRGRGERLTRLRLARRFRAVIALPTWGISTARAFAAIDRRKSSLTLWRSKLRIAHDLALSAVTLQDAMRLGNTFEEVLGERRGGFVALCDRLHAAGADLVRMTGSGSAVFGVLPANVAFHDVLSRFSGVETLYGVQSRGTGLRIRTLQ